MKPDFMSILQTPWGDFGIYAGMEGITEIRYHPEQTDMPPVPYDLKHAWNAYETGLSDSLHLPLDLTAEPQVQLLYLAVRSIPRGETRELTDVIRGTELTLEAAQEALDACPLPLAIPLHRVLQYRGLPEEVCRAIRQFEAEHPRLPKPEIPWIKK